MDAPADGNTADTANTESGNCANQSKMLVVGFVKSSSIISHMHSAFKMKYRKMYNLTNDFHIIQTTLSLSKKKKIKLPCAMWLCNAVIIMTTGIIQSQQLVFPCSNLVS